MSEAASSGNVDMERRLELMLAVGWRQRDGDGLGSGVVRVTRFLLIGERMSTFCSNGKSSKGRNTQTYIHS